MFHLQMCARCLRPLARVVLPSSATSSVLSLPPVRRSCTVDARGTETASTLSRSATSHVTNTSASSSFPRARVGVLCWFRLMQQLPPIQIIFMVC